MKIRHWLKAGILLACFVFLTACSEKEEQMNEVDATENQNETVEAESEKESQISWSEEQIAAMTLEEKAAQLFIITPEALTGVGQVVAAGDATMESLNQYPVGGLIYFSGNIQSAGQMKEMIANSQQYSIERIGIPLFISIDEEGGEVARIANSGVIDVPVVENLSDVGTAERAYEIGQTIGGYLSELGVNLDYAPVADVLTNPENTVVRYRAFGADPEQVADMVQSELKGLHEYGVYGTVKHFPGHGATTGDTHEGYAYTDKSLDELLENELLPFIRTIDDGAAFIMAGHISVPTVTGDNTPASLSKVMITDILRNQLGYQGIVITDALNMGAVAENYSPQEAAVRVLEAGCDLILMPDDFQEAYQGVLDAVHSGRLTEERLDESLERILTVKECLLKNEKE